MASSSVLIAILNTYLFGGRNLFESIGAGSVYNVRRYVQQINEIEICRQESYQIETRGGIR